ncbi:MAG: carbohydrate kinase family protein [Candidatus Levybacteria bacterium]|nr:carbohydrate kinase family protein [Candidatus Levybacteria bacterium]
MMPVDVLCIGNATIDVFVLLKNLQKFSYDKFSNNISFPLGEKVPLDEHKLTLGGNAANLAVGLKRLGLNTALAAEIGSDEFSEKIVNTLKREEVNQTYIKKGDRQTPYFNIVLSYAGDRTILDERTPSEEVLEIGNANPKYFYLTGLNGNWEKIFPQVIANNTNSLFAFNPGSRQLNEGFEKTLEILPKIEILFVNLAEAQKIINEQETDIKNLMVKLKEKGPKISVVTDGINGSYAINKDSEIFHIGPISKDKPVERTGAGDSYAGAFLYAIIKGKSIEEAMRYGAINADSVIKKIGAQDGLLKESEIEQISSDNQNFQPTKI